jgi:hypothetical protein
VANTPALGVGLLLSCIVGAIQSRNWRWLVPLITTVGTIFLENWIRRGNVFAMGYAGDAGARTILPYSGLPGFSYPIIFGILSILFSFGKGLIFYSSTLFLQPHHTNNEQRRLYRLMLAFLIGMTFVYSQWWSWYGGFSWGPRFFAFVGFPASLCTLSLLANFDRFSLKKRLAIILTVLLSVWVGVNGVTFRNDGLGTCIDNSYQLEFLCWYAPEFSPLWHPFVIKSQILPEYLPIFVFGASFAILLLASPVYQLVLSLRIYVCQVGSSLRRVPNVTANYLQT